MSHETFPQPEQIPSEASYAEQSFMLIDIQKHQEEVLENKGILEKARVILHAQHDLTQPSSISDILGPPSVTNGREFHRARVLLKPIFRDQNSRPELVPAIRFTKRQYILQEGSLIEKTSDADVILKAYDRGGRLQPALGFESGDVGVVEAMLHGLKQAKKQGLLPDLNATYTAIIDPSVPLDRPASKFRHPSSKNQE